MRSSSGPPWYIVVGSLTLLSVLGLPLGGEAQELELHFLDVGQGDSTLIVCPSGSRILVDAGSSGSLTSAGKQALRNYLLARLSSTDPELNAVVITHGDSDHYNMLRDLLKGVYVERVLYGGFFDDYNYWFRRWLRGFEANGRLLPASGIPDPPATPSKLFDCGDAKIWVLAANVVEPTTRSNFISNTRSVVLRIAYGDFEAVLTGDATFTTEDAILAAFPASWLDVDLLKLGHHGSRATSCDADWVSALTPEIAIASAGRASKGNRASANGYGHPSKVVFDRVIGTGALAAAPLNGIAQHSVRWCTGQNSCSDSSTNLAIYSTVLSGTTIVRSDGSGWTVEELGDQW